MLSFGKKFVKQPKHKTTIILLTVRSSSPFYNTFDNTRGTRSQADLKSDNSTDSVTRIRAGFDADKCVCCTVEKDQVLVHSGGGKGYGVGALGISSGCYQWKVFHLF